MKKGCIIGLGIAGVFLFFILIGVMWGVRTYNSLVTRNQAVEAQWANVETSYQRRMDLIPNFVNTVKGAANFEQQTLTQVIEARAKATQIKIDASKLNEQTMAQFQQAQGELSSSLNKLMAVVESYPELKATQNYRDLQVTLEGTENRIATERRKYNEAAQDYNGYKKRFPQTVIAGMFSFQDKPYFKSQEGADKAPAVNF
jgi:LemA protein